MLTIHIINVILMELNSASLDLSFLVLMLGFRRYAKTKVFFRRFVL